MSSKITKSYSKKLFILSYIPIITIIVFSFFIFFSSKQKIDDVKNLENNVYNYIVQSYELNYLQDERFLSISYELNDKKLYVDNLSEGYTYFSDINSLDQKTKAQLSNFRKDILKHKIDIQEIEKTYSEIISKYIKDFFISNQKFNNQSFSSLLNTYQVIVKSTEKYYESLNYFLFLLNKKNITQKDLEKLNTLKININFIEKELMLLMPNKIRILFENVIEKNSFKKLNQLIDNTYNNKLIDYRFEDINSLKEGITKEFFILNNYIFGEIETDAVNIYQKELRKLVSISVFAFLIILFVGIFGRKLKNEIIENINENIDEINSKNFEIQNLYKYVDQYVILSKTDLKGNITYVSKAFCEISKYSKKELLGKPHNIIRHPDMSAEIFGELWETITKGEIWSGEIKNRAKDGSYYWTKSTVGPTYNEGGDIIGYTSVRQDISSEKYALYLNNQVKNLLDNANEGFLSFSRNLKIKDTYSKKSLKILSKDEIKDLDISHSLFFNDELKKEIFDFGIKRIMESKNKETKEVILSILPSENTINNKTFSIKYKLIGDYKIMVILEDISEKLALENKIKYKSDIQKMIVAIATRKNEFIELKTLFIDFVSDIDNKVIPNKKVEENYLDITKSIHTFKGLFAQEELVNITTKLHDLETRLLSLKKNNSLNNETLKEELISANLINALNKDLDLIYSILGKEFLDDKNTVKIEFDKFREFELKLVDLVKDNSESSDLTKVYSSFLMLNQKSLKSLLEIYPKRVKNMANRLSKSINEVEINGDEKITVSVSFEQFIKNLVHVFRNMIDHGIEASDERVVLNKHPNGTIKCDFYLDENKNIKLIISDDGRGIDNSLIKDRAIQRNIISKEEANSLSKKDTLKLIFCDNFSTKNDSDIISGRGIGLNSVLSELEKINGNVDIETELNKGTKFIFTLPSEVILSNIESSLVRFYQKVLNNCKDLIKVDEVNIVNISNDDNFNYLDFYSCIKIDNLEYEMMCIFSGCSDLLETLVNNFTGTQVSEAEKKIFSQGVLEETLNTALGKSLADEDNFSMSAPIIIDTEIIENLKSERNYYISKILTNLGEFNVMLIFKEK